MRPVGYAEGQAAVARVIADTDVDLTVAEVAAEAEVSGGRARDILNAGVAAGVIVFEGRPRRYRAGCRVEGLLRWGRDGDRDVWPPGVGPSRREADPPLDAGSLRDAGQGAMF